MGHQNHGPGCDSAALVFLQWFPRSSFPITPGRDNTNRKKENKSQNPTLPLPQAPQRWCFIPFALAHVHANHSSLLKIEGKISVCRNKQYFAYFQFFSSNKFPLRGSQIQLERRSAWRRRGEFLGFVPWWRKASLLGRMSTFKIAWGISKKTPWFQRIQNYLPSHFLGCQIPEQINEIFIPRKQGVWAKTDTEREEKREGSGKRRRHRNSLWLQETLLSQLGQ